MTATTSPETQHQQQDPDAVVRIGGWLFERRTWLPLPLVLTLVVVPAPDTSPYLPLTIAGIAVVALGEALRLWGVHHIGVISRTRSDRLGPLIAAGPFAFVRNPLYLGNIALWVGFALSGRLIWMVPIVVAVLGLGYHAIVRWEERLLTSRLGDRYRSYMSSVPRWIPRIGAITPPAAATPGRSWSETLFSERGTLIAIAAGYLLLWLKLKS
jgi:protein-S-isoprenylcysteine O-methyltransferase Ste14